SDWYATKTAGPAANGGLDLVMPGPDGPWGEALVEAVRRGEVPEAVVDEHLRRLLRLADRVGVLSNQTRSERSYPADLPAPDSGQPGVRFSLLAADGRVLEERVVPDAKTSVGFDDELPERVVAIGFRARLELSGELELGGSGAGQWSMRAGDQSWESTLRIET